MACPRIEVRGKRVILLSGYNGSYKGARAVEVIKDADINAADELRQSARRHPDAVAFGYVAGRWVPAA
jgi:hypothetical protein